jgi:hypothetical protein
VAPPFFAEFLVVGLTDDDDDDDGVGGGVFASNANDDDPQVVVVLPLPPPPREAHSSLFDGDFVVGHDDSSLSAKRLWCGIERLVLLSDWYNSMSKCWCW